jgi:hypothetical protein
MVSFVNFGAEHVHWEAKTAQLLADLKDLQKMMRCLHNGVDQASLKERRSANGNESSVTEVVQFINQIRHDLRVFLR